MTARRRALRLFLPGALLGFAVFLSVYGLAPLDVTNDAFLRGGYIEQDIQQHYAGWLFYRQSPLSLPLCVTERLNWPQGTSVAFTDSIPLFAAFFRLLEPLLPAAFQYFGWYTALCFALQGGFAALLLGLFLRSEAASAAGSLLFSCSPVLLERAFRHTSLAAQFLILTALYYYFKGMREGRYSYKGLFALNCLAIALHPYFVPMTFGLTFALLAAQAARARRFAGPAGWLAANLAGAAAVGWLFGVFGTAGSGAGGAAGQYGYFCMNLNALWNPVSRGVVWSLFLPAQNQTLGNYDGFNYLGLGILLAAAAVALWGGWRWRRGLPALLRRHWALALVCLCFALFAVSSTITANGAVLARLPLPQALLDLASVLRSSGRLFWPVYYLIFLAAVAGLWRLCAVPPRRRAGGLALAAICLVQLLDLSPALAQKALSLRQYSPSEADLVTGTTPALAQTSGFFEQAAGRYQTLVALDPLTETGMELALWAADSGMNTTDTSIAARYDVEAAEAARQGFAAEIADGRLREDCLYLTERPETFLRLADAAARQGAWCGALRTLPAGEEQAGIVLYVIAPGLAGFTDPLAVPYGEDFPLTIAEYSDDHWYEGVLSLNLADIGRQQDENRVVLFYDTPLARRKLAAGRSLMCEGEAWPILEVDGSDAGWLMVTLDTGDARPLAGKELTVA